MDSACKLPLTNTVICEYGQSFYVSGDVVRALFPDDVLVKINIGGRVMKCSNCGSEITGQMKFCGSCGAAVQEADNGTKNASSVRAKKKSNSGRFIKYLIPAVLVAVIAIVLVFTWDDISSTFSDKLPFLAQSDGNSAVDTDTPSETDEPDEQRDKQDT